MHEPTPSSSSSSSIEDDVAPLTKVYQSIRKKSSPTQYWMPILEDLASECRTILELGAKKSMVTWALLHGLCIQSSLSRSKLKFYILNDTQSFNVNDLIRLTETHGVLLEFYWQDDLTLDVRRRVDMVVIDTIRIYAHLKLELQKFSQVAERFLVILNTVIYGTEGEFVHDKKQTHRICSMYGYSEHDVDRGLMPAIAEFLETSNDWSIHEVSRQGHGMVVLIKN